MSSIWFFKTFMCLQDKHCSIVDPILGMRTAQLEWGFFPMVFPAHHSNYIAE